jgi:hypothetical protein
MGIGTRSMQRPRAPAQMSFIEALDRDLRVPADGSHGWLLPMHQITWGQRMRIWAGAGAANTSLANGDDQTIESTH